MLWDDNTKNVVDSDDLVIVSGKKRVFKRGIKVKMLYKKSGTTGLCYNVKMTMAQVLIVL